MMFSTSILNRREKLRDSDIFMQQPFDDALLEIIVEKLKSMAVYSVFK